MTTMRTTYRKESMELDCSSPLSVVAGAAETTRLARPRKVRSSSGSCASGPSTKTSAETFSLRSSVATASMAGTMRRSRAWLASSGETELRVWTRRSRQGVCSRPAAVPLKPRARLRLAMDRAWL